MKPQSMVAVLQLFFCAVLFAADGVYRFDMGPEKSPVWPGFTLVTAKTLYTPERGFGWIGKSGNEVVPIEDYNNYQPDDLARDLVVVKQRLPLDFRLDLPNGDYRVWVLSGDDMTAGNDWYRSYHLIQEVRILAEGKEAFREQRDYWGLQDVDYVPGQNIWDKYIKGRYIEAVFPVTVSDGALDLRFEGLTGALKHYAFPVNAIMVFPAARAEEMEREIAKITEERRKAFLSRWTLKQPKSDTPPLEIDDTAKRFGYVLFVRNYLKLVFPDTTPEPAELQDTLQTFAAQGEWESVSFCIRPIRDLKGVTVTVSELRSQDGTIPAENVRVSVIKYQELTNRHSLIYQVAPYTLMHWWKRIDIPAALTKQYWLKIRVPDDAKPGFYEGRVTVAADNAPSRTLKLQLRVLPFQLMRSKHASWFYFGNRRRVYQDMNENKKDAGYWEIYRKEIENLREHGFCVPPMISGIRFNVDKEKKKFISADFSALDEEMAFLQKENALPPDGFLCFHATIVANAYCGCEWIQQQIPVPRMHVYFSDKPEDVNLFIEMIRAIDEYVRKKGWGLPVFECGGELSNYRDDGTTYGMRAYGAMKKAGVLTGLRGNGPSDYAVIQAGLVDFAIPNIALIRDEWTDTMKQKCKGLWLYNFSNGRYGFGFFAWKKGATRRLHEGYIYIGGRPWDDFDAGAHNWHVGVEGTRDGVVSRVYFEHMAEGRDDYDYLFTCEELLKQADQRGTPKARAAVAEARKTLKFIADQCFTDYDYRGDIAAASGMGWDAGCRWSPDDFQKYRWLVAREIMRLQEGLK